MRILHVMASKALGGAETYSTDVMLSLHKAGIDQCVVMDKDAPRFQELQQAGLRMAPAILSPPFLFWQQWKLTRLIKLEKPDVVQSWMRRGASLLPAQSRPRAKASKTEKNAAQSGRAPNAQSRLRLLAQSSRAPNAQSRLRPLAQSSRAPICVGWFGGYYDPAHFKSCAYLVGVTRDIVAHMVKGGVPAERAHFIPTFPDIAAMPPVDRAVLATPRDAKVLLALARLHPKKGLDTLLEALRDLPDCVVWLAGDGPLRRELENLAATLGVIDRVRFLGWRTDRAALLRAADILVVPSRYEPFGTVILEAWAAGTPLVACASAGPAATIEDGVTGLLTPINDAAALTATLRKALDDDALRRRMVAQGYAAYIKDYTREAVTQRWLDFYKALLAGYRA